MQESGYARLTGTPVTAKKFIQSRSDPFQGRIRIHEYRNSPANLITINNHCHGLAACGAKIFVSSHKVRDGSIKIFATGKAAFKLLAKEASGLHLQDSQHKLVCRLLLNLESAWLTSPSLKASG